MWKRLFGLSLALSAIVVVCYGETPSGAPVEPAKQPTKVQEDFPYVIDFEQGVSKYEGRDQITISEVHSTSKDMRSGICRISGTYKLDSHDTATLAGSVTARDAKDGVYRWNSAQTMKVDKGSGTFTLLVPISVSGWPHVSFYDEKTGFGGVYIGTGDSVLKQ